jgi:O-antigen ligase
VSLLPFVFTFSRASYLAFIPMYFTVVFLNRTKKRNTLIGALIIAIVLGAFFFPQNVKDRLADAFTPEATMDAPPQTLLGVPFGPSASARIFNWKTMIDRWKAKPFLGYGLTGQGFIDGQYIRTLVEMGALGLTAFLLLLYALYRNTLYIYNTSKDSLFKGLALGFLAGHIGMMVHAIATNTFILIRVMEPYWFLAGIIMAIPKIEQMEMPELQEAKATVKKVFRNTDRLLTNGSWRLRG